MIFIAEIGMNYNGNFPLCYELIRQAKFCGASIVKFQCGWRDNEGEINQLNEEKIKQLKKWSDYFEIDLMFSILNNNALELVKKINPKLVKIASRSLVDNMELVSKIIELNVETLISFGMWEEKNIKTFPFKKKQNMKFLWCDSKYPTFDDDIKKIFPNKFGNDSFDGYSDHCIGISACLIAISRGANIIEKHFTLDKSDQTIRDHALSATPDEFRQLTSIGYEISKKIKNGF